MLTVHGNAWKGGRVANMGYVLIWRPDHPNAMKKGYVAEHTLIAERVLGRLLTKPHEVHHFDEDKSNNSNNNLVVCEDREYHSLLHARTRAYRATGDPTKRKCINCKQWDLPINLLIRKRRGATHRRQVLCAVQNV